MNNKTTDLRSKILTQEQRQLFPPPLASACPFRRSALSKRSPVSNLSNLRNAQMATVSEVATNDEAACHSEAEVMNSPASCREALSLTPTHIIQSAESYSLDCNEALKIMSKKLKELRKMMDGQRHVNQQMKSMLSDICKLFMTVESRDTASNSTKTTVTKATQTTASAVVNDKAKRARSLMESDRAINPIAEPIEKRSRIFSPPTQSILKDNLLLAAKENRNTVPKKGSNAEQAYVRDPATNQAGEWTKVVKQKRAKSKPIRPDAIVVKKSGDLSYADILKIVKNEETLKSMSSMVRKIRKTAQGDLLFQLSESSEANTSKLQAGVGQVLSGKADVKKLTELTQLEIRDIDEVTTHDEICLAVNDLLANVNLDPSNIRSLRKAYGGTQTASVTLPADSALKLISIGKIRIGWVVCRIREKIQPQRCFKCLGLGHTSRNCTSNEDFKDTCFKCGKKGHFSKKCTNSPKCILCNKKDTGQTGHYTGSSKCPIYLEALQKLRKL